MVTTTTQKNMQRQSFPTFPFDEIQEPGVYVTSNGEMFRIPPEALAEGHSPLITWLSESSNMVTFITSDVWAPISKIRQITSNADLKVNF